jgi:hypothetical protein
MTRQEIEALKVGDSLENTMDVKAFTGLTELKPNARWSAPRKIVSIGCVKEDLQGRLFILGYTTHGPNSEISFSIKEGEAHYRVAK